MFCRLHWPPQVPLDLFYFTLLRSLKHFTEINMHRNTESWIEVVTCLNPDTRSQLCLKVAHLSGAAYKRNKVHIVYVLLWSCGIHWEVARRQHCFALWDMSDKDVNPVFGDFFHLVAVPKANKVTVWYYFTRWFCLGSNRPELWPLQQLFPASGFQGDSEISTSPWAWLTHCSLSSVLPLSLTVSGSVYLSAQRGLLASWVSRRAHLL